MERHNQPVMLPSTTIRGRQVTVKDVANAKDYFEHFLNASSLKNIFGYYRSICDLLNLKPNLFPLFYPKLRGHLTSWRAKALWKKFDVRASHKCYGKNKICANSRVLIIGAGPCGLRTAIEAQLLGAKVVVVEKRDRLSRNNVLHLWPFVIEDLRMLGAKKFFGKFCAGAIDHISIRQIQCILLKVALLLGVEVHTEVGFERLIEPNIAEKTGWRAEFVPSDHPVAQYEFDVIIGADGKRNTLQGFKRKEFRGKLAIAITANFMNKRTEAEARVEEISGVAFIFNQKFFKELHEATGIDLENIVYYKDDTHYFVMTAKKPSLIEKGVIKQDLTDTERLLAPDNVNREALMDYAREAANFSTNYQMPDVEFAINHYGQPDVAMFDFTSMYAAENASKVVERQGYRLLMVLVGDSLLEPFWPTGSGCARGFLSSMDAAWTIRSWNLGTMNPLDVLAERESIYRLLAQTTPDNLNKDWKAYTLDPATRYPNLNKNVVVSLQTTGLFDTDNPKSIERLRRNSHDSVVHNEILPKKRRRENIDNRILLHWIKEQVRQHDDIIITDVASVFRDGKALCAILNHYRPDLFDYTSAIKDGDPVKNNQLAMDVFEKELGITPVMTGEEITKTDDYLTIATYLTEIYDTFRCEIPHIKHPRLELPEIKRNELAFKAKTTPFLDTSNVINAAPIPRPSSRHKRHADAMISSTKISSVDRKTRKRRTLEKVGASVEERQKILQEIATNRNDRHQKRRQLRRLQTEQFVKSMQMLQANCKSDHSEPFEDYSIFLYRQTAPNFEDRVKDLEKKFTYVPDHENKLPTQTRGNADEDFAARIKNMEDKVTDPNPIDKKPKDLYRAIGKIETSDWNIKEIEKKIKENKQGKSSANKDKEKVPKWSKEQFVARQTKMEKQHLDRQDSAEAKFADIDRSIKNLELKLKEGTARELGTNKIASITSKLSSKVPEKQPKPVQKSQPRPAIGFPTQSGSEFCHFCGKRVYLMERLSSEGRFFHHGCFKCQYCHTQLRLGSYAFDRDGIYDHKFFCIHHYGMQGEVKVGKVTRKPSQRLPNMSLEKSKLGGIAGVDLLDRVGTPERVVFSNLSTGISPSPDHNESLSQMDEDEWTDRNFGASTAEFGSSDDESSSLSDTDSDDEDAYEEAMEEPATKEGTLKWAERFNKRYSKKRNDSESDNYSSSDQSSYCENTSDGEDSDTATEGEEEIRQRELRKQEVRVEPPVVQTDTGTDTEVVSDESSSDSSSEIRNSATEISTDSEFAHDDPTPTREIPSIVFNDANVTKTRGSNSHARRFQVTSGYLQKPINNGKSPTSPSKKKTAASKDIKLKLRPLVPATTPVLRKTAPNFLPTARIEGGYALNRTQSTGGIAVKVSLELKKKYLLGECGGGSSIQKSGSASTLDTKFKSFHTNISDCQKLLKNPSQKLETKLNEEKDEPEAMIEEEVAKVFENVLEGRPRSPVHETSIIVPTIDWSRRQKSHSEDSLSEDSFKEGRIAQIIPSVEVEEIPPDSLCLAGEEIDRVSISESAPKSITSEKKSLNQPKKLPDLDLPEIHDSLHVHKLETESDNDSIIDQVTTALTETELSDWARDGAVSSDLELYSDEKSQLKMNELNRIVPDNKTIITEAINTVLSRNLDHIEFMDTGTETSSDDGVVDSQNGYVLFKDEEDPIDSLDLNINNESDVHQDDTNHKNTGYCVIGDFGGEIIDLKPSDLERLKSNKAPEHDEDSLLILDGGTTTEENTCSDSTVKNVTEIDKDKNPIDNNNFQRKRMEEKLAKLKAEVKQEAVTSPAVAPPSPVEVAPSSVEFDEHCHRLLSKIEFGNAKDSIDIRKSRRKSKDSIIQKPDLIKEESSSPLPDKKVSLELRPVPRTPDVLYNKEEIEKERDVNQRLVQEMVMSKLKAENKSLERKKRRGTVTPNRSFDLMKSATTDVISVINLNSPNNRYSSGSSTYATPDVILPTLMQNPSSSATTFSDNDVFATPMTSLRPLSVFSMTDVEKSSLPDVRKSLFHSDDFKTPVAPPRVKHEEAKKTAEKLKHDARVRARLLSNEELGLSPEDKLKKLREKLGRGRDDDQPWFINDTLNRKKNGSLRRSKSGEGGTSTNEMSIAPPVKTAPSSAVDSKIFKSDPNLLDTDCNSKKPKKKVKDRERRKSITKLISTFFKKSPTSSSGNNSKGLFSRISPKSKDVSKSCANLDLRDAEVVIEEPIRRKSFSEMGRMIENSSPPPVPPLPLHYTGTSEKCTGVSLDDSSDGEHDLKPRTNTDRSSCDTLDQILDSSASSLTHKRSSRGGAKRAAKQAQVKRHRMAQEIQRKLEETEVKTRELEQRGVVVEKALRGEEKNSKYAKEEAELMQEWFDLMRDRTELRRYERELIVRAQELELEDRHSRLQHELRERLENNERKTDDDMAEESSIITEMMDIVAKRDSLISLLEEDRLRYSNEDRDFEEQMLAKGLRLTPIRKSPEK